MDNESEYDSDSDIESDDDVYYIAIFVRDRLVQLF